VSDVAPDTLASITALERRPSVERQVAASLRELIVTDRLPQGTPLRHRELADRLGVSPTPVRAVLGALEREGLVEIGRTGRAIVSRLTREDLEEVYAARLGLEGLAARLGAAAVGDDDVAGMRELLAGMRALAERGAVDEYLARRWRLHAVCYRATGRHRLVGEVERLFWRAERYNRLILASKARFRRSLGHYREFVKACAARDGEAAEAVIHASIRWAVDLLWESLPSERALTHGTRVK
jgi:GntR family transcriptional regulator, rspAB operon transcriptional repressor